jgi:uridylate kinase
MDAADTSQQAAGQPSVPLKRVILKLSGESFTREKERGIHMGAVVHTAGEIQQAQRSGCQMGVVIGGGNILRGAQFKESNVSIRESTAHYMGMLATVINGLALRDALESLDCQVRLMSAIRMDKVCETYILRRAQRHLEKGRVVILAAGTGGPFLTTDTAAALRASELEAEALLKATKVRGVYSEDPENNPNATFYPQLDCTTVLERGYGVIDATAIAHCRAHGVPVVVFNYDEAGNILRAVKGEKIGTRIDPK